MLTIENQRIIIQDVLDIDLSSIYKAESRLHEVGFITPQKAPELISLFLSAHHDLKKLATDVLYKRLKAKRRADTIRGIILLDKVPGILTARGLASSRSPLGSEDVRDAILNTDSEYTQSLDTFDALTAVEELLDGKTMTMAMAYSSVKEIMGEGAFNFRNPNLSGGDEPILKRERPPPTPMPSDGSDSHDLPTLGTNVRSGFGIPRYK